MSELTPGQVTVADLYRELTGIRKDLTEVLSGSRLSEERHNTNVEQHQDYERRLRLLERGWMRTSGAAAAVAAIVSVVTYLLSVKVH